MCVPLFHEKHNSHLAADFKMMHDLECASKTDIIVFGDTKIDKYCLPTWHCDAVRKDCVLQEKK